MVQLLCRLIIARIFPANAFEFLVKADLDAAFEMLLRRYVGKGVCPDTKFGGYQFELSTMLTDLVETQGETSLYRLLQHANFNRDLFSDQRLLDSIYKALDIESLNEKPELQTIISL